MSSQTPTMPIDEMTLRQLRRVASEYEVSRYSRMRKVELVEAIKQKQIAAGVRMAPTDAVASMDGKMQAEAAKYADPAMGQAEYDTHSNGRMAAGTSASTSAAVATAVVPSMAMLATVDDGLSDLPGGYGESRIMLLPRDPQWAYAYWDIPNEHKQALRNQGGSRLALRFYDVTDIDINSQSPHSLQQYECGEVAREWYLPVPVSDRDYSIEVGYICDDGRWLVLSRSAPIRVPPVYPSDWVEDQFVTVDWNANLRGSTVAKLVSPSQKAGVAGIAGAVGTAGVAGAAGTTAETNPLYAQMSELARSTEAQRVAGSLFGSMHQVPQQAVSSFVFPSGAGLWALPTASGVNMSGAGLFASAPPAKPRKFWLVADAELIVYGATEPDATVTVDGEPIELTSDGTFRFQMSFQDGMIRYPIVAVAKDGEQTRSIHMDFERKTLERNTNTKAEAVEEWFA
ncbi:MAG: Rho termination protein [Phormidesmis priestleyi]|uniref:Rho termination protein n=1 Tax=Phormidesmis priestleyi TaxID=268141 RepID=A0A2W4ZCF7_9CYAN|nr:MAG: Rho termination protein [Phormidesmis priestleyi]